MPAYGCVNSARGVGNLVSGHEPYHDILGKPHEYLAMDHWEGRPRGDKPAESAGRLERCGDGVGDLYLGAGVQRRLHLERARYGEKGLLELAAVMSVYTMNATILRVLKHQAAADARHLTPR